MAQLEAKLVLGTLLQRYKFALVQVTEPMTYMATLTLPMDGPLNMTVSLR